RRHHEVVLVVALAVDSFGVACLAYHSRSKHIDIRHHCPSDTVPGDLNVNLKDLSGTVPGTIHYKFLDVSSYENDITVGAAMILANVSVFTPKPSKHYLNITKRNVVEVFRKDTGEKSSNPRGDPRSPLGTGMGMKNDSPMGTGMGMRLINEDGDVSFDMLEQTYQTGQLLQTGSVLAIRTRVVERLYMLLRPNHQPANRNSKVD
ncbi:transposase, MuDR, MULE transposase domain protein, partial [Tanacetum coccineum]